MSDTFIKITEKNGTVVTGDDGSQWIPIDSDTFDQVLAQTAATDASPTVHSGTLALPLPTGEVDKILQSLIFSGQQFASIEVATYGSGNAPPGDLTDDYTFTPDFLTAGNFSGPAAAQDFTISYTEYQDQQTTYDESGNATGTTLTKRNMSNGRDSSVAPTAPALESDLDTSPGSYPDPLTYEVDFRDSSGQFLMDPAGSIWSAISNPAFEFDNLSIATRNAGASSDPTRTSLTFELTASAPNVGLVDSLINGLTVGQIELTGFSAAGKVQDDDVFVKTGVSGVSISGNGSDLFSYTMIYESYKSTEFAVDFNASTNPNKQTTSYDFSTHSTTVAVPNATLNDASTQPTIDTDSGGHVYDITVTPRAGSPSSTTANEFSFSVTAPDSGTAGMPTLTYGPLSITFAPGSLSPAMQSELAVPTNNQVNLTSLMLDDFASNNQSTAGYIYTFTTLETTAASPDGNGGGTYTFEYASVEMASPACFCRGTLILTSDGEVPVEELAIGDLLVTLSGEVKPIRWIGQRGYDGRFIAGNRDVLPICIKPDAIMTGVPARTLWVSPEHSLYLDDVLVQAKHLVNGSTVVQAESVPQVEYFHIELETHDIIYADGVPTETFVDCDNRLVFANGAEYDRLYPHDDRPSWRFCAPRLEWGSAQLGAIREWMFERARQLGPMADDDSYVHLLVDGAVQAPVLVTGRTYRFELAAGFVAVWLGSRSIVPAEREAGSYDIRRLGVPLERIVLSDAELSIEAWHSHSAFRDGFHSDEASYRWTDGHARIPDALLRPFTGLVTLEVQMAADLPASNRIPMAA